MINTPTEVLKTTEQMALKKYQGSQVKLAVLGLLGGAFIAMGGLLSFYIAFGSPTLTEGAPGFLRLMQGIPFPLGLILIVLVGGELVTGNTAILFTGARKGLIPWRYLGANWLMTWLTNFAGAVLFCYFLVHLTGLLQVEPWHSSIINVAVSKVSLPWHVVFLKGVAANWLVCLAIWLGLSSNEMIGRMIGLWLPVMTFVTLSFEHSVANMFYLPMGMMSGANVTIWEMLWRNIIPATLGNIVGGAILVGMIYSYAFKTKE